MWELDYKESWAPKNWCFWTAVLEKTPESLLDYKEIKPVNPEGNQSWIFIGRTDGEAETPVLWPPDAKNWLIGKDPDAGKDWRQEEKGMTEDEIVGWHHWLNGREFEQALGVDNAQGSLVCCSSWGHKESDTTEWLNWTDSSILWAVGQNGNQDTDTDAVKVQDISITTRFSRHAGPFLSVGSGQSAGHKEGCRKKTDTDPVEITSVQNTKWEVPQKGTLEEGVITFCWDQRK